MSLLVTDQVLDEFLDCSGAGDSETSSRHVREAIRLNGFFERASGKRSLRMRKHFAQISDYGHSFSRGFSAAYEK